MQPSIPSSPSSSTAPVRSEPLFRLVAGDGQAVQKRAPIKTERDSAQALMAETLLSPGTSGDVGLGKTRRVRVLTWRDGRLCDEQDEPLGAPAAAVTSSSGRKLPWQETNQAGTRTQSRRQERGPLNSPATRVARRVYLPHARYPEAIMMALPYIGEELGDDAVIYLDERQREACKLTMRDGLLRDAQGALFDTTGAGRGYRRHHAIYVMDPQGNIYASNRYGKGVFHHSSFLAGGVVAAAGHIEVFDGVVGSICGTSGHYLTQPVHLDQAVDCLKSHGATRFVVDYFDSGQLNQSLPEINSFPSTPAGGSAPVSGVYPQPNFVNRSVDVLTSPPVRHFIAGCRVSGSARRRSADEPARKLEHRAMSPDEACPHSFEIVVLPKFRGRGDPARRKKNGNAGRAKNAAESHCPLM